MAQLARNGPDPFLGLGVLDPQEIVWQVFAKTPVNLADRASGDGAAFEPAAIDPSLDGDMRLGL
jgi:hypothetical protein